MSTYDERLPSNANIRREVSRGVLVDGDKKLRKFVARLPLQNMEHFYRLSECGKNWEVSGLCREASSKKEKPGELASLTSLDQLIKLAYVNKTLKLPNLRFFEERQQ